MKKLAKYLLVFLICILSNYESYSQNKIVFGFDVTNDLVNGKVRPGFGLNITRSFNEKSSFEIGTYYRSYIHSFYLQIDNHSFFVDILERHLSIPLTYKFSSRIINLYAGPCFEVFLNWKQKGSIEFNVDSYDVEPDLNFGAIFKAGKDVHLSDKMIFEPEIRFNPITRLNRLYFGLGLNFKFKI